MEFNHRADLVDCEGRGGRNGKRVVGDKLSESLQRLRSSARPVSRGHAVHVSRNRADPVVRDTQRTSNGYGIHSGQIERGSDRAAAACADSVREPVTLDQIVDPALPRGCLIAQSVIAGPTLPAAAAQADALLELQRKRIATALLAADVAASTADDVALQLTAINQSLAVLSRTGPNADRLEAVAYAAVAAAMSTLPLGSSSERESQPQ